MTDAAKANNPSMQTHQAALEVRRAMEQRFIVPHQAAKGYGAAVGQGVKNYVAYLPASKQPVAPSVAGKMAQKAYNALRRQHIRVAAASMQYPLPRRSEPPSDELGRCLAASKVLPAARGGLTEVLQEYLPAFEALRAAACNHGGCHGWRVLSSRCVKAARRVQQPPRS
jgi:hypothetical protein